MVGGWVGLRGAGGLVCRLRRLASLTASAGPHTRLRWDSEGSAQDTRLSALPAQEPCTGEESPLPAHSAASRDFPSSTLGQRWLRQEPKGLLTRRVLAAGLRAAGGTTSPRGLATRARPKKPPRQWTSQSSNDQRPTKPRVEASGDLVSHYKAVLQKILAGHSYDGFRLALREAKQKGHLVPFHQAIVNELKHNPPAKLKHEILLHSFASDIRAEMKETERRTMFSLAKTMLCFKERVKELVLLTLGDESLAKFQRSAIVVSTLKCLSSLVEHTDNWLGMVEELRSDAAWVEECRRRLSQELGREEPALNLQATFRLVRLAQELRFSVSEDDCRGLCRSIRWELREWEGGNTCWLRSKDLDGMLKWMRKMHFHLWEEEAELLEALLGWILDPDNSDTAQHPYHVVEILAGLAADDFGAFSSAVAKVGRGSELGGLLSSLYGDRRRLALLDKRGQYFLYKLDSLIGINEGEDLPRMPQPVLDSFHFRKDPKFHEILRVERAHHHKLLDREEFTKVAGQPSQGYRHSLCQPVLQYSSKTVVVEHPAGARVPMPMKWELMESPDLMRPPQGLRLFFPLNEWEQSAEGRPLAEVSQQMAFLRRLGYDVVPFHLDYDDPSKSPAASRGRAPGRESGKRPRGARDASSDEGYASEASDGGTPRPPPSPKSPPKSMSKSTSKPPKKSPAKSSAPLAEEAKAPVRRPRKSFVPRPL